MIRFTKIVTIENLKLHNRPSRWLSPGSAQGLGEVGHSPGQQHIMGHHILSNSYMYTSHLGQERDP